MYFHDADQYNLAQTLEDTFEAFKELTTPRHDMENRPDTLYKYREHIHAEGDPEFALRMAQRIGRLKLLRDLVIVKPFWGFGVSRGVITEQTDDKPPIFGTVLAVSPAVKTVELGSHVLFERYDWDMVDLHDEFYHGGKLFLASRFLRIFIIDEGALEAKFDIVAAPSVPQAYEHDPEGSEFNEAWLAYVAEAARNLQGVVEEAACG